MPPHTEQWLSNEALAAWLQAFAAAIALIISVWAVLRTGAVERRKDKLRARAIAVAIYPEVLNLESVVNWMQSYLNDLRKIDSAVGQSVAANVSNAHITMPAMIERNIDNLYLLGEPAGPTALQLVNLLGQYNSLVVDVSQRMMAMNAEQWKPSIGRLDAALDALAGTLRKAADDIRPIHDAVKG